MANLERRLGRNPRNSSAPPSSEGLSKPPAQPKPNRAQRRAEKKKRPGKQPGSEGHHLAQVDDPDEVVAHRPGRCGGCHGDLSGAAVVGVEARQVFDLPRVKAHVTEHQMLKVRCGCGSVTKAAAPPEATAPACYGPGIRALAVYLSVYQHIPYDRLGQIFADVVGVPVSVGAIKAMVAEAGGGLGLFQQVVTDLLRDAPTVHFDETGARVAGRLHWIHVASSSLYTLLCCDPQRGRAAMDDIGVIAKMSGVAVHDGFSPYRAYEVVHSLCNAHHLRELEGVIDHFNQDWARHMADLLLEAKRAVDDAIAAGRTSLPRRHHAHIRARYRQLVAQGFAAHPTPTAPKKRWYDNDARNLLRRLDTHQDDVLRFTTDFRAPFDNNQAERDVRMIKLQQKISGSWRTKTGADHFCAIRSYIATMKKHRHDILDGLTQLFHGGLWLPGGT